jgi:L-histidine Nalpha-methyltransferase
MLADVRAGLALPQKELSPTWFYDEHGSRLFEEITRLPEYYLTRAEHALLELHAATIATSVSPATVAELGAGAARKSRILIDAALRLQDELTYIPVDVSGATLAAAAQELRGEFAGLHVRPLVADVRTGVALPDHPRPLLYAFLGSTLGNFTAAAAADLLSVMRSALSGGGRLLLGVDLAKDPGVVHAAYNDSRGVTAAFNLNLLRVLNRELGAGFDLSAFEHRAFYDERLCRVEMHLVSTVQQAVFVPGAGTFRFAAGETIRTEISTKYERSAVERLLRAAGLRLDRWISDDRDWFALVLAAPCPTADNDVQRR